MKTSLLLFTLLFISAADVFTQDRPRYYDNFETNSGVRVQPTPTMVDNKKTVSFTSRVVSKSYLPSPPVNRNLNGPSPEPEPAMVRKAARVTMTVYEGYADSEVPRTRETERLTMAAGKHMKGYSTGDELIDAYIVDSSRRYSIDPLLIYAQMSQESSFKVRATSNKGASGLMQLMPPTARRMGVANIYDPKQNIEGGVKYMRLFLDMFGGDVNLALAGYNAGEGAVVRYGYQIPPYNETQDYVRRISGRYRSISNATTSRYVQKTGDSQPTPQSMTVRLADGRARLINK